MSKSSMSAVENDFGAEADLLTAPTLLDIGRVTDLV